MKNYINLGITAVITLLMGWQMELTYFQLALLFYITFIALSLWDLNKKTE